MSKPGRLSAPTQAFNQRSLTVVRVPKSHRWVRIHRTKYSPVHFGNSGDNRFDAPNKEFGTLYVARQFNGSFVEVFCRNRLRLIDDKELRTYRVAEFQAFRSLKLVDLAGKGLVRMGLDARLATGSYKVAQSWAKAIYEHPDRVDGILYPSRHDTKQQLAAIFDRAQTLLAVTQHGSLRDYLGEDFYPLLDRYDIALL